MARTRQKLISLACKKIWKWKSRTGLVALCHWLGASLPLLGCYNILNIGHFILQDGCSNSQPSFPHSSQPKEEQKKNTITSFKDTSWKLHTKLHNIPMARLMALVIVRGAGKCHLYSRHPCAQLLHRKEERIDIEKQIPAPLKASEKQIATKSGVQPCNNLWFSYYCWTCGLAEFEG